MNLFLRRIVSVLSAGLLVVSLIVVGGSPAAAAPLPCYPDRDQVCIYSQVYYGGAVARFSGRKCHTLRGYSLNNNGESLRNLTGQGRAARELWVYDWDNCKGPGQGGGWMVRLPAGRVDHFLLPARARNDISSIRII